MKIILLVSLAIAVPGFAVETCTGYLNGNSATPQVFTTTCFAGQTPVDTTFTFDPSWTWPEAQARYLYKMASQGYQLTGSLARMSSVKAEWYYYFQKN